jgi:hypothetical protein
LSIGSRVRFTNHGGTPSLNSTSNIGVVANYTIDSGSGTATCVISYDFEITAIGSGGQLVLENMFVLAKGRIQ